MPEPMKTRRCHCPFCNEEILEAGLPFCQFCGISVFYCPLCQNPVPPDSATCPRCGADICSEASVGFEPEDA